MNRRIKQEAPPASLRTALPFIFYAFGSTGGRRRRRGASPVEAVGVSAVVGATGAFGALGIVGASGAFGTLGTVGATGAFGSFGIVGATGAFGALGIVGATDSFGIYGLTVLRTFGC